MFELDFLPIEKTGELGSRSGDAIAMRFTQGTVGQERVVVIDGGFGHTGDQMVDRIRDWYDTDHVDLVISTHPDQDHINGLGSVLEAFSVGELMIHIPHDHTADASHVNNIEVVDALIGLAYDNDTPVTEPFAGLSRFDGQLKILGPTRDYYDELLVKHLDEVSSGVNLARTSGGLRGSLFTKAADLLERAVSMLPMETLGEDGETSPRNNSSVVTLITGDETHRMLFTGDVGIQALNAALDRYESVVGPLVDAPLDFFQAPHHGSRRNISPSVLNRLFGPPGRNPTVCSSFISSAKADPKHPSPKVTNALKRRGVAVYATESNALVHHSPGFPLRDGYGTATSIQPLAEDDD